MRRWSSPSTPSPISRSAARHGSPPIARAGCTTVSWRRAPGMAPCSCSTSASRTRRCTMPQTAQALLKLVEQQQVEFISLQFTDIVGMVKNVTIPVAQLPDCLTNGVWFDGSSIEGLARFRIAENDMFLAPDLDSYALIPWDTESGFPTARLICDVLTPDGRPFPGDPRSVLKRVLQEAQQHGFEYMVAPELEFFLFKTDSNG